MQHKNHGNKGQPSRFSGAGGESSERVEIQYGHNGTHVVIIYSRLIANQVCTEEETERAIASLQNALEGLRAHKAGKPPGPEVRVISQNGSDRQQ